MTRQGLIPIHGTFRKRADPSGRTYYWMTGDMPVNKKDNQIDSYALLDDYVTVTPIQNDQTDYSFLEELNTWKI
jgi:5'-nucleotidase